MTRILLSAQVEAFRSKLHPEHRRELKRALVSLGSGKGDIRPLDDELQGYYRLRVGEHRIVFRYDSAGEIRCLFAERRKLVYDLLRANPRLLLGD